MSHAEQIEALKGLLERVKAADKANWTLSLQLHRFLALNKSPEFETWWTANDCVLWRDGARTSVSGWPHLTKSVDEALSLTSRALPGWDTDLHLSAGGNCIVSMTGPNFSDADMRQYAESGVRPTGGLAVCEALLSAKLALLTQEEGR